MLSAHGVHQYPCLPKPSPNPAESGFEGHAKGRKLGTLGQEPVRFVKVTHKLVNYKKTRTSKIKLGEKCMNKKIRKTMHE